MNELRLTRTRPAMPSLLGDFAICPAKYLLESESHSYKRLPLHPKVILGSIVHHLADSAQQRKMDVDSLSVKQLENSFSAALTTNQRIGPVTSWIHERYGITGLVSRQTIVTQIRYARSLVSPALMGAISRYEKELPVGRELILTSDHFDLQGRADLIYQDQPDRLKIVDFKTGKVNDEKNQPKDTYLLQIAAYGIMVKELVPEMKIRLEITGIGDSWAGSLDNYLVELVTNIIGNLNDILPRDTPLLVSKLARTGSHCTNCSCRCSCPAYTEVLRSHTPQPNIDYQQIGMDIYGQLLEMEGDNHLVTIKVVQPNNHIVKIFRIPSKIIPDPKKMIGRNITLYGLKVLDNTLIGNSPLNFLVINTQDTKKSAFNFHLQLEEV